MDAFERGFHRAQVAVGLLGMPILDGLFKFTVGTQHGWPLGENLLRGIDGGSFCQAGIRIHHRWAGLDLEFAVEFVGALGNDEFTSIEAVIDDEIVTRFRS